MSSWPFVFLWSTYGGNYRCCPEGILQNTAGASGRAQEGGLPEGRGGEPRAGVRFPHHEEIVWLGFWNHKMLSEAKEKKWECRTGDKAGGAGRLLLHRRDCGAEAEGSGADDTLGPARWTP